MLSFLSRIFSTDGFPPRWQCGEWAAGHGWLHVISDTAIFGAYAAIPIVLIYFVLRRNDIAFSRIFWLFGLFIFSCGAGHLIEATIFWHPWYRLSGVVKLFTAVVSWLTVIALIRITPLALNLPGLAQTNRRLLEEIKNREQVEARLREKSTSVDEVNSDLLRLNGVMLGREDRILELKEQVNRLLEELGREPDYDLTATADDDPGQAGPGRS